MFEAQLISSLKAWMNINIKEVGSATSHLESMMNSLDKKRKESLVEWLENIIGELEEMKAKLQNLLPKNQDS